MNSKESMNTRGQFLSLVQFALILAPVAFFFDASVMYRGRINLSIPAVIILLTAFNGGLLLLTIFACRKLFMYRKDSAIYYPEDKKARRKRFLSVLPVSLVAAAFSALAALQFDNIPRFDGGLYYDALITATETFTFTPASLVSSFTFFTHPMQSTGLFAGIGEMLFPRQAVGVYGVTLIVTITAIFCLYGILGRIFPNKAPWLKAAGTAVFAFCPYVLGLFAHFSPDYFTLMFFIILIYAFAQDLDYLAAFLSLILIFSKETGILFAASFLVPAILIRAGKVGGTRYFNKLKEYLFPKRLLLYGAAPLLYIYNAIFLKNLTFGQYFSDKSALRWDNDGVLCFGSNIGYISARLNQILYVNFFWVIALLLVIAGAVYLFRRNRNKPMDFIDKSADFSLLSGIVTSSIVYVIFSCLFITIMCPRYNVYFALPISLISVGAISYVWKRQAIVKFLMGALIILFLLQNYFNLDPFLSLGNQKIDLGYEYIYSPTGRYGYMDLSYLGETYVYNNTYSYADDLLDQAMEKINPDKNDHFLVIGIDWYELYLVGDPEYTKHLIYWDPIHQKRTYDYKGDGVFLPKLSSISSSELFSDKVLELADDFYFIVTAREDGAGYSAALAAKGYDVTESFVVKNYIGYLTVYHMTRNK